MSRRDSKSDQVAKLRERLERERPGLRESFGEFQPKWREFAKHMREADQSARRKPVALPKFKVYV